MPPKRKRESAVAAAKKPRIDLAVEDVESGADEVKEQKRDEPQFVHEPYKSDVTLLSLVDDCFFSIFDRLSLHDLCSVAQTCKHLQQVSTEHFLRRHKSKVLIIENVSEYGDLATRPNECYVKVFAKSCGNVTLGRQVGSKAGVKRLAKFFETYEMHAIKRLRFDEWTRGLTADQGLLMANMLHEVESFTLSKSKVVGDLHNCILQHLPSMIQLTIREMDSSSGMSYKWLKNSYPNLRYFAWHTNDQLPIDLLRVFFQTNRSIRFFSLKTSSEIMLQQLDEHNIRVNELFFNVRSPSIFAHLKNLCSQQGTRLHLMIPDGARWMLTQNMAQFTQLSQYIDGLYFQQTHITKDLFQAIAKFGNLKILQLCFSKNAEMVADIPTLQELYAYWSVNHDNFPTFKKNLLTFASRMPNLKRIYLRNNSQPFRRFKFNEMDVARKKLLGAGKLEIHIRTDELSYMGTLNDIQREYDTIGIERIESEEVKNPLVNEYLVGKHLTEAAVNRSRRRWGDRRGNRWDDSEDDRSDDSVDDSEDDSENDSGDNSWW